MAELPLIRALYAAALSKNGLPPDAELMGRYAASRDGAAFELLVRRHADLVWAACIGVLGRDRHAAEDAFQATFLTLARKAGAVRTSLPGWLFRVARRTAARAGRRPRAVPLPADWDRSPAAVSAADAEAAAIVLEEVERLAARLRDPVLLCFYQGHTHAEAAAKLGWPLGTVASRLARAKDRLRDRLTRRGVTLPAAAVLAALDPGQIRAAVATTLGPPACVPAAVLSLSNGVLFAMRIAKLKLFGLTAAAAVGVSVLAVTVGVGQDAPRPAAATPAGAAATATALPNVKAADADKLPLARPTVGAKDSDLRRLQIARFNLALEEYQSFDKRQAEIIFGTVGWEKVTILTAAAADVFSPVDATAWYAWRVAVGKRNEGLMDKLKAVDGSQADATAATRRRVEAEIDLLKWTQRPAARGPKALELAREELRDTLASIALRRKLIDGDASDVDSFYSVVELHTNRLRLIREIHGDTVEALKGFDECLADARSLLIRVQKWFESGTARDMDLRHAESHVAAVKKETAALKARLTAP